MQNTLQNKKSRDENYYFFNANGICHCFGLFSSEISPCHHFRVNTIISPQPKNVKTPSRQKWENGEEFFMISTLKRKQFLFYECSILNGEVKILKNCVFSPLLHERFFFLPGLQIVLPSVRYSGTNLWLHCFFQRENLKPVSRDIKHHTLHSLTLYHLSFEPRVKNFRNENYYS